MMMRISCELTQETPDRRRLGPGPCPSPDSPRSRRRLASSPARVGGKVGRRDGRGEGAQKATRAEGREGPPSGVRVKKVVDYGFRRKLLYSVNSKMTIFLLFNTTDIGMLLKLIVS